MSIKVSVVVPVYNAGEFIQPCIDSLTAQSLDANELELIFVDDGSTDDSLSRLQAEADRLPNLQVISMENSGWPGKPRNVGTRAATGEYVQYVDQDDYLGPEALERMYELGRSATSDVVVGKMVGVGRWTPTRLFQKTRTDATLDNSDLVASLTPHKMFRRQFLADHGIEFPEGKRRLEDFVFVMRCYVEAKSISVLADYPCYFYTKRSDGKNTSFQRIDPTTYFENLGEVVAVVNAAEPPGPRRDALLERFYRSEVLRRLSEPNVLKTPGDFLDQLVDGSRKAADQLFSTETREALAPVVRARAMMLAEGRVDRLVEFAHRASELKAEAVASTGAWEGETLRVDLEGRISRAGKPWVIVREEDRFVLSEDFTTDLGSAGPIVVGASQEEVLDGVGIEVLLRDRNTSVDWSVPHDVTAALAPLDGGGDRFEVRFAGPVRFSPLTLAGGESLSRGSWDPSVRLTAWGISRTRRVAAGERLRPDRLQATIGIRRMPVVPYATDPHGNLTLDTGQRLKVLKPPRPTVTHTRRHVLAARARRLAARIRRTLGA